MKKIKRDVDVHEAYGEMKVRWAKEEIIRQRKRLKELKEGATAIEQWVDTCISEYSIPFKYRIIPFPYPVGNLYQLECKFKLPYERTIPYSSFIIDGTKPKKEMEKKTVNCIKQFQSSVSNYLDKMITW